mgnify:CR=1 FL=1
MNVDNIEKTITDKELEKQQKEYDIKYNELEQQIRDNCKKTNRIVNEEKMRFVIFNLIGGRPRR